MKKEKGAQRFSAIRVARIATGAVLMFASQVALASVPNVEIVTLLVLVAAMLWGRDAVWMALIFALLEGILWGFGVWWLTYLVIWPGFAFLSTLFHRHLEGWFLKAVFMGAFGLAFGGLFALAYLPFDPRYALNYWIMGIPFDLIHGAGNFAMGLVAGKPVYKVLSLVKETFRD